MRHRSKKKEAEYRLRRPLVERLLAEREWCEACPIYAYIDNRSTYQRRRSVDIHEAHTRARGGDILNERHLVAICRPCHRRATDHTLEAEGLGLVIPSWVGEDGYEEAAAVRESWAKGIPRQPFWL